MLVPNNIDEDVLQTIFSIAVAVGLAGFILFIIVILM